MSRLLGRHEFKIDAKGRVSFPAAFRRSVSGGLMVLHQWQPTHLDLYPEETWERIYKKLMEHKQAVNDKGAYLRQVTSRTKEVELDSAGRIRIPPLLRKQAGLDGAVVFIGALDRIELWNPERFEEQVASRDMEDDDFAAQIFS